MARSPKKTASKSSRGRKAPGRAAAKKTTASKKSTASSRKKSPAKSAASKSRSAGKPQRGRTPAKTARSTKSARTSRKPSTVKSASKRSNPARRRPGAENANVGAAIANPMSEAVPAIYQVREPVEAGGLISFAQDTPGIARRWASFVDRIIRGASPDELPVEQPTKYDVAINLKTAKALGLTVPPSLLVRADEVIE